MLQFIKEDFSIRRASRPPSYSMKSAHFHNVYELYYMEQGSCTVYLTNDIYKMETGTFILIPPHAPHKITYLSGKSHSRLVLYFSEKDYEALTSSILCESTKEALFNKAIHIPERKRSYVQELLNKIFYEYKGVDDFSVSYCFAYGMELLLFLMRCQQHNDNVVLKMDVGNQLIQQVMEHVMTHYHENITLSSVARRFSISTSSLSKKFKAFSGYRFKDYVIRIRIHAASELLLNTGKSITEISDLCGFSNSNFFGDTFKRIMGLSPAAYRKR